MNNVTIIGWLTQDPQTRTAGELQIANLRVAVPRRKGRDGEERGAAYIDVVTFDGLAKVSGQFPHEGPAGRRRRPAGLDRWEKDGQRRQRHEVVADTVEFLDTAPQSDPGPEPGRPDAVDKVAEARERLDAEPVAA